MDIAGAKALKQRLAENGVNEEAPASSASDVSEDAPPVYLWTGVSHAEAESPAAERNERPVDRSVSKFRRLRLSFR